MSVAGKSPIVKRELGTVAEPDTDAMQFVAAQRSHASETERFLQRTMTRRVRCDAIVQKHLRLLSAGGVRHHAALEGLPGGAGNLAQRVVELAGALFPGEG